MAGVKYGLGLTSLAINMTDYQDQRYEFYCKLQDWIDEGSIANVRSSSYHLAKLLGFRSVDHLLNNVHKDDVIHTLQLLNGPNGLTVYKMLLIRRR